MAQRKAVTKEMARNYERATRTGKTLMLDQLCALTGWTRRHARRALAEAISPPAPTGARRGRPPTYGPEVKHVLRKVWAILDGPSGKRLAPFLPEIVDAMERHGELTLAPAVRTKLLAISAATIDRALAPERKRLELKGRSGTKPGSLLKGQIPIRTFSEWDEARPGFFEVDLVAHDGGDVNGVYCYTLTLTDVCTGWTETRALRNRAHRWVLEAMPELTRDLPVPMLGFDSDNGSEFINGDLYDWLAHRKITFTRSRPYRKNDNCFVEQKNGAVVRQAVGYLRYDTDEEHRVLGELYTSLRLYVNYFQPQMHLVSKTREGAKVQRRHDRAKTPHQRMVASAHVAAEAKERLQETYLGLNPVALRRTITELQARLLELSRLKEEMRRKEVRTPPEHPWRTFVVRQRGSASRTS
jgi:transposase InsO family protein